jgi:hypothetical protein
MQFKGVLQDVTDFVIYFTTVNTVFYDLAHNQGTLKGEVPLYC